MCSSDLAFAEARCRTGRLLGRGVVLFVLAPIPLIVAANLTDDNAGAGLGEAISDGLSNGGTGSGPGGQWAVLIGLALTLVLVATGVLTLMRRHQAFVTAVLVRPNSHSPADAPARLLLPGLKSSPGPERGLLTGLKPRPGAAARRR